MRAVVKNSLAVCFSLALCISSANADHLRDLRGVAEGSFFAVGDNGVILHGDGNAWRKLDSPFPGTLLGIWGGTNRPLYAVGADGAILVHED